MPTTNESKSKSTLEQEVLDQQLKEAPVPGLENVSACGTTEVAATIHKKPTLNFTDVVSEGVMDLKQELVEALVSVNLNNIDEVRKFSKNKLAEATGLSKAAVRSIFTAVERFDADYVYEITEDQVFINPREKTQEETDMANLNQNSETQAESQEPEMGAVEESVDEQVPETEEVQEQAPNQTDDRELPPIEVAPADYKCPAKYLVNARYDVPHKKFFVGWDFYQDFNPKLERYFVGLSEFNLRKWFRQVPSPEGYTSYKGKYGSVELGDKKWRWWGLKPSLAEKYLSVADLFNERCTVQRNTTTLDWEDDVVVRIKNRKAADAEETYSIGSAMNEENKAAFKQLPKKEKSKEKIIAPSLGNSASKKAKEEAEVLGAKLYFAFCDDKKAGKLKKDIDVVRWMRMKADNYDISLEEVRNLLKRNGLKIM